MDLGLSSCASCADVENCNENKQNKKELLRPPTLYTPLPLFPLMKASPYLLFNYTKETES